jgi:hypothetical protein
MWYQLAQQRGGTQEDRYELLPDVKASQFALRPLCLVHTPFETLYIPA